MRLLLTLAPLVIFISSCTPVTATVLVQPCPPRPASPEFKMLNAGQSVCSRDNEAAKASNASALRAYSEKLEALVECYESFQPGENE